MNERPHPGTSSDPAHRLFVVSAPSGAGKTSLVNALIERHDDLEVTISHTTRPMRRGEADGVNYHFISEARFLEMLDRGEFVEDARVFGNRYGTSHAEIERLFKAGHHVILEIDWQGASQIRRTFPDATQIFILPPSLDALRERLSRRGQDDADVIEKRIAGAITEISHCPEFDYLVINDDFDEALSNLSQIIYGDPGPFETRAQLETYNYIFNGLLQQG